MSAYIAYNAFELLFFGPPTLNHSQYYRSPPELPHLKYFKIVVSSKLVDIGHLIDLNFSRRFFTDGTTNRLLNHRWYSDILPNCPRDNSNNIPKPPYRRGGEPAEIVGILLSLLKIANNKVYKFFRGSTTNRPVINRPVINRPVNNHVGSGNHPNGPGDGPDDGPNINGPDPIKDFVCLLAFGLISYGLSQFSFSQPYGFGGM